MLKIKELREKIGMSQIELAAKSGVSTNTISLMENGKSDNPNKSTLKAIASALGVSIDQIKGE